MVFEILKVGEENALSPDYLRIFLGLSSNRVLQKQIEDERAQGKVILSSTTPPGGYYLPKEASEIRRFIRTLLKCSTDLTSFTDTAILSAYSF